MSKLKSLLGISLMMAQMADPFRCRTFGESDGGIPDKPKTVTPKGLQKFNIQGETIYALNKKTALKKFRKLRLSSN